MLVRVLLDFMERTVPESAVSIVLAMFVILTPDSVPLGVTATGGENFVIKAAAAIV